jgi:DNA replication protein DnaC
MIVISEEAKRKALEAMKARYGVTAEAKPPSKTLLDQVAKLKDTRPLQEAGIRSVPAPINEANDGGTLDKRFQFSLRELKDGEGKPDAPCKGCQVISPLFESGLCWDCNDKEEKLEKEVRTREKNVGDVLGGVSVVAQYSFENFRILDGNKEAYNRAKAFNPYGDNIFLTGDTGTGKSHLLYAMAAVLHLKGYSVVVRTAKALRRELEGRRFRDELGLIESYSKADVFCIDELGFGEDNQKIEAAICEILDNRKRYGKNGLVVTSNHTIDGLQKFFGDHRLTSRLFGMCQEIVLEPKDKNGKIIDFRKVKI